MKNLTIADYHTKLLCVKFLLHTNYLFQEAHTMARAKKETTAAAAPAAEKKVVRKAPAAEKKTTKTTTAARTRRKKVVPNFVIQSSADQSVTYDTVIEKVKAAFDGEITSVDIYVKAEEGKAYYVINGDVTGAVDLF
jgi:hypothetical protein